MVPQHRSMTVRTHVLTCVAFALVVSMSATFGADVKDHRQEEATPFADIADPAARAAIEGVARSVAALSATVARQSHELDAQRAHAARLEARLRVAEGKLLQKGAGLRRMQQTTQPNTTLVRLHRATVRTVGSSPAHVGSPTSGGGDDGEGHRRLQGTCSNFAGRISAVNIECCDEPREDCSSGAPATCNVGCAGVFLPFWADCRAQLPNSANFLSVVAQCQAAAPGAPSQASGLAHQLNLVCARGTTDGCVPTCAAPLRGDLLLLNLNGGDFKYSCERHHGLHSWVGAATDGGYLGSDAQAFLSAVLSGAAGYYALALGANANIAFDLTIRPNQDVHITGNSGASKPIWGTGSFTVQQAGSIVLADVSVGGDITAATNSSVQMHNVLWRGGQVAAVSSQQVAHAQCFQPYTTLRDRWRSTSTGEIAISGPGYGGGRRGSDDNAPRGCGNVDYVATGVGGGRWYRFDGAGGDALPLTHPGVRHCGTVEPGWLSGWNSPGRSPPHSYSGAGRYPTTAEGVVEMTACFDAGAGTCYYHAPVGVVQCWGVLLWRLPYVPECDSAYCTTSSGL
jgi:hypothetical protein